MVLFLSCLSLPAAWADPPLQIAQNIPTAYTNDGEGRVYQATIANPAGTVGVNLTRVELDIPGVGFAYVPGTLTANDGAGVAVTVSGTDPVIVDLPPDYELPAGASLTLEYRLSTDFDATEGDFPLTVTAFYDDTEEDFNDGLIIVVGCQVRLLMTPVNPSPYEIAVGESIEVEVAVENTGPGPIFNVDIEADWGTGFGNPRLTGGDLSPVVSGDSYQIAVPEIPSGTTRFFRYALDAVDCEDLTTKAILTDPCDPAVEFTRDASPLLRVEQPNVSLIVSDVAIPYCGSETMEVRVRNDNASGDRGPARNFRIETDIPQTLRVDNVAAGWSFDDANAEFVYDAGTIPPGVSFPADDVVLSFDLTPAEAVDDQPDDPCSPRSGTIRFFPVYDNECGDPFIAVPDFAGYAIDGAPDLSITKTAQGSGGDDRRVFLGETITFTVTPSLTLPGVWSGNLTVTDIVPEAFVVSSATATAGTVSRTGNDISWELTPDQAAANSELTITTTATTDECFAGQDWNNTAEISGETDCGCPLSADATANLYLQSQEAGGTNQNKSIINTGPFDVCSNDEIQYESSYTFTDGTWSGSSYTDPLDANQSYVNGSAEYNVGSGFSPVPAGSISVGPPLVIDLGFLDGVMGGDDATGTTLTLRYNTTLSSNSLSACQAGGTIVSRSTLVVNGTGGGCGGNQEFYQMVEVPLTRTAMGIGVSLEDIGGNSLSTVSKGQPVRALLDVSHLTGTPASGVTITVDTTNYAYLGNPVPSGFGGFVPSVDDSVANQVTFTFADPLTQGGAITFDAVKTCDEYDISARIDYGDACGETCFDTATAEPQIRLEGDLILNLTPDQFQVTSDTLSWTIFVTNGGSGTAYDVRLTDQLKDIFDYESSTVDGVVVDGTSGEPTIGPSAVAGYNDVVWSLGDMAPNEVRKVVVSARTNGDGCDFTDANTVIAQYGWEDQDGDYSACDTEISPSAPVVTQAPSRLVLRNEVDPITLCGTGFIRLTVTNTGETENYNIDLTQKLNATGFVYVNDSARVVAVNGVAENTSINNPQISGTDLTWTFLNSASHYLSNLESMAPGDTFTIEFEIQSDEAFNNDRLIESEAVWQRPCQRGSATQPLTTSGAGFTAPIQRPNITMRKDGRNVTTGQVGYTETVSAIPGETVEWRIRIVNNGDAAADNVELNDVLPSNMTADTIVIDPAFSATTPTLSGGFPDWTLNDVVPFGGTASYLITSTVNANGCTGNLDNTASVAWGCTGATITSPSRNSDTATLATQPSVTNPDIYQEITDFTTAGGTVVITLEIGGAPMYNATLTDDLTDRFEVAGAMTYSANLPEPDAEPADGTAGNAPLEWSWTSNPIPPGVHTISFPIRNTTTACPNGDPVSPALDLDYFDACGNGFPSVNNTAQTFPPGLVDLVVTKTEEVQVTTTGNTVTWTIEVENAGDGDAGNVTVEDVLGDGFQFQSARRTAPSEVAPDSAPAVDGSGSIFWNDQAIPAGETFTYEVTANFVETGSHLNEVTATAFAAGGCLIDEDTDRAAVAGFAFNKTLDQTKAPDYDNVADAPGEIVTYTITADFQGNDDYQGIVIQDTLPDGLEFVSGPVAGTAVGDLTVGSFSQSGTGNKILAWTLNDFSGTGTATISYQARILRENDASRGDPLNNSARATFDIDFGGGLVFNFPDSLPELRDSTNFTMKEPILALDRTANPATTGQVVAGQTINHTLAVSNRPASDNTSPAYETRVTDVLPFGARIFDPTTGTITVSKGGTPLVQDTDFTVAYDLGTGTLTFDFLNTENGTLASDESFVIQYETRVDADIAAGVTIAHNADVPIYWSQPDGAIDRQSYDDVPNRTVEHFTTESSYTKTLLSPADGVLSPGEEAEYEITFTVPANTSVYDIGVVDTLPVGMEYVAGSSSGPEAGSPALEDIGNPAPVVSGQTLTWFAEAGTEDIVNNTENDVVYTITYRAVVRADAGLDVGDTLQNEYIYNFNTINGDSDSRTDHDPVSQTVTVALPALTMTKEIVEDAAAGGDEVTIRLTVTNPGGDTAYAVTVTDLLNDNDVVYNCTDNPPRVEVGDTPAGWTFSVVDADGDAGTPHDCQATFSSNGGGNIASGQSVEFVFRATLADTVGTDSVYTNTGRVQGHSVSDPASPRFGDPAYDSLPAANDTDDIATPAPTATGKILFNTSEDHTAGNEVAVGEVLTYELRFQFPAGTTRDVVVADILPTPPQHLQFTGNATLASDPAGAMTSDVPDGDVTMDDTVDGELRLVLGNVVNASGASAEYVLRLEFVVANDLANQEEVAIENRGRMTWIDGEGNNPQLETDPVTVTVVEPNLQLGKTVLSGADPQPGGTVRWEIFIANNGNATAFQLDFREVLPDGLFEIRNVTVANTGDVFLNGTNTPLDATHATITTTANNDDTLTFQPFQIAGGSAQTTIVFDCTVMEEVSPGEEITNAVRASYTSLPDGGRDNSSNPGNVDDDDDTVLNNYEESAERTLNAAVGAAGDTVWLDLDGDGVRNAGEPGIANVLIRLFDDDDNLVGTRTTDGEGRYFFTGIPAGNYRAEVDPDTLPPGLTQTAAPLATFTVPSDGAYLDVDFGYQNTSATTALAGDRVWHDVDGDGIQEPGEPGIGGVTLELLSAGPDGSLDTADDLEEATTTTAADGGYLFADIASGQYLVRVTDTADVLDGYTLTGGTNPSAPFTLAGGDVYLGADFGYQNPALFSISDRVWLDANGDGVPDDPGEPGFSGVTVSLRDRATGAVIATTITDGNGDFTFPGLPSGDYVVSVTDTTNRLAGFFPTTSNACCGNLPVEVSGADVSGQNFAYNRPGVIGDTVWNDADGNGAQDSGEAGIAGVTVQLYRDDGDGAFDSTADTDVDSAITDINGVYLFATTEPGTYFVSIDDTQAALGGFTLTTTDDETGSNAAGHQIQVDLANASDSFLDADFGYQNAALPDVSGTVWNDTDGNGNFDGGEPFISGVTVALVNNSGAVVATNTTDANGDYRFFAVPPGDYSVVVTDTAGLLSGYFQTAAPGTPFTVATDDVENLDFGYVQSVVTGTIGDTVWLDADGDGDQNGGESGISDVTVYLDANGNGTLDGGETSAVTNGSGFYEFTNLPAGIYLVAVDETTLDPGLSLTTANEPLTVALSAGDNFDEADFGYQEQGEVFGHLFIDTNGDGTQQADEPDLSNVEVVITDSLGNDIRVTSDENGDYRVLVPVGNTTVDVDDATLPAGYVQTAGTDPDTVTVSAGSATDAGEDGYQPQGTVFGHLFVDEDGNGAQDPGEPDLPNVDVIVTDFLGGTQTVATDADGNWSATVPAGETIADVVESSLPTGYVQTAGTDPTAVDVPAGSNTNAGDDGYRQQNARIGDFVWNDLNGDGIQDDGEPGISGVTVYLDLNGNGLRDGDEPAAVTDADGGYLIGGLPAGTYTARVDSTAVPEGFALSSESDALERTLIPGETRLDADFGYRRIDGGIGDRIWNDRNGDGVQDPDEPGIPGVTAALVDPGPDGELGTDDDVLLATTTTDADGRYLFPDLPAGTYAVLVTDDDNVLENFNLTTGNAPFGPFELAAGENRLDADFGYRRVDGALGDRVWIDANRNGVPDPGEPGIPNVLVRLLDETGAEIGIASTDIDGRYRFDGLPEGEYSVEIAADTVPPGLEISTAPDMPVVLGPGEFFPDADFGYISETGAVGDTVWHDANGDGVRNPGEPGIGGATLELIEAGPDGLFGTADDVSAGTATTAPDGTYLFPDLPPGFYRVAVSDADGVLDGYELVSGPDPSAPVRLEAGEIYLNADFGYRNPALFSISDRFWLDANGDGVPDPDESGIPGVAVSLRDASGATAATALSDADGRFSFPGLPDGEYSLVVTDTAGILPGLSTTTPAATAGAATATVAGTDVFGENFGYNRPGVVGDTVWNDADGDGAQGPGEAGIAGVAVHLYRDADGDGNFDPDTDERVDTAITDVNGVYRFATTEPGVYFVGIDDTQDALGGFALTTADDFQGEAGHQIRVALAAASDSFLDADFGYRRPDLPDVSGTIWNDQNANATAEEEEPPFAEVTVRLVDDSGRTVAETTTDSDGFFRFPDVPPGDYVVTLTDLTGELVGFDRTTPAPSYPIAVTDADIPGLDFGFVRERIFGCLGDRVWRDDDGDGVEDPDEPGLPGVRVFLDTDDNGRWDPDREPALVTDENGFYRFTGLPPGDYVVRVDSSTVPAGYVLTGGTDPRRLTLVSGQECRNSDFGYQPRFAALGDRVWLDLDENGVQDPDEPGASGVLVRLLDASGDAILAETVTDGSGTYRFDGLSPGTYRIEVALPEDYAFTTPEVGTELLADVFDSDVDPETGRSGPVVLEGDQWNPHLDAGLVPPGPVAGSIGDRVWYDLDGDGIQDPEEPGVSGAVVRLLDADGDAPLAETVSDGLGRYRFDGLSPGQYLVEFVPPPGFVFSPPGAGDDPALDSDPDPANGRTAPVTLPPGADISAVDAGLRVPDVPPALLGDRVWRDDNGDGIQTAGEPGVSGATVILLDADAGVERARIVTDPDGNYRFEGLPPGEYRVRFVRPDGFAFSPAGAGGDPAADSDADAATGEATASLAAGQDRIDLDAGLIPDVPPLTIGDLVWVDANDNGLPDPGEGRAGVRLTLQDADGRVLAETVAGANGDYAFADLPPGDYRVTVDSNTLPPGVVPISDPDGGLDNLADVVNLSADRLDVDFGYGPDLPPEPTPTPPPVDPTARLGDRVWEDMDGDGIQDEDEPGFPGVTVRLFDAAGTGVLAETVTDADGRYLFFGLTPGAYQVEFVRPPGYVFAPQGQTGPGRDSNPDPDTGRANASLSPGAAVLDVDAGLIPTRRIVLGDFVWRDGNGNGLPDPGEGLGGVRVVLTDGAGATLAETVTDEAGGYRFPDLPPGDYGVRVDGGTLPDGLEPFVDPEGPADGAARLPDQNADNLDVDFGYRPVGPPPDLGGAVKTAADLDGGELLPGDEIAYAVTLRNEGAGAAREVIYVDTPDPFSRLVPGSVTSERGTVTLGNGPEDFSIRVEIGTLEPGESIRVRYRVTVAADAAPGSWIVNQGMLMAAGRLAEPTEWPVSAPLNDPTVIGPIPGGAPAPAMMFTKSAADLNGAPLRPGDVLEYGFTVRNDGPETAAALMVFDGPPIGTALVPGSATADRGTVVEGNPIEWMVGELGPGEMFQGRFQVIVNAEIAEGAFICNQAALLGDGGLRLESLAPDGGETCLPVAPADDAVPVVRAVKRVADLDGGNFSPGDRVAYRVTLVNPADVPAEGVVFSDPMNGRVPLIPGSVTADRGAVQTGNAPTDTEVRVSVGTMAPGERVDIVLEARISPDAADGEIIPNQGRVEWAGGSAPTDDPATATPDDPTDVVVFRPTGERVPPRGFKTVQGDWPLVSWTLRYENDDDRPMILHVEDPIPEGARIVADSVTATFGTTGVLADPERAVWDGVVPAGGAVEIGYRVRVDDGVFRLDNQACAIWDRDGDGLWTDEPEAGTDWICTDDPTTPAGGDPTVWTTGCELLLGDRVWIDTDADGVCRSAEERSPDGVRLSLYRDANGDNHYTQGVDPWIAAAVTETRDGVSGVYRFDDLCPGDYIVGVDASNFGPGGVLEGMRPTIFGGDPDNDRDDDSNGEDWGGAGVLSPAVSLRWNLEPLDEDGDPLSNLTVDFGFIPPPPAPEECPACGPFKPF